MPTFDPGGGSEKKNKLIKSVKNLIKKHYHIKMSDVCNKNHMKVHHYNSLHLAGISFVHKYSCSERSVRP